MKKIGINSSLEYGRLRREDQEIVNVSHAFDPQDEMFKIKSMQKKFRDSFSGASLDPLKWDSLIGTGGAISQASSILTMGSGTTANATTYILSKETFTIPVRLSVGFTLSQRVANHAFTIELISVNEETLLPDGLHSIGLVWDGTTVTQAKYKVQNGGLAPLLSAGSTFPTTAGGGLFEIEPFADEAWFHGGTMDSAVARTNSYRRHQQIPDPNAIYKVKISWVNGATPPASNTNALIQFLAVQDYAELTAEITAGRGQSTAGQALGVIVVAQPALPAIILPTPLSTMLVSAATTNATSVRNAAANLYAIGVTNLSAATKYLKFYNKASAPTVGTDVPVLTIPIPATSHLSFNYGAIGLRFSTGIALAITGAMPTADTTAVAAGDVQVLTSYM